MSFILLTVLVGEGGVAILLSVGLNYEDILEYKDKEGRHIMTEGTMTSLLNVYIPMGSDWSLYRQILATTRSHLVGNFYMWW